MKKIEDYLHLYLGAEVICTDKTASSDYEYYGKKGKVVGGLLDKYSTGKWSLLLRPLSSMTEEEKIKWSEENEPDLKKQSDAYKLRWFWIQFANDGKYTPQQFSYLLSRHFDLFGLIDAGLALDATNI